MTDEPYLILHKVRGEPAFDIAIRATYGDEEGWCVATSGHRAFPMWHKPLDRDWVEILLERYRDVADWPDHYEPRPAPTDTGRSGRDLLRELGLAEPLNVRRI